MSDDGTFIWRRAKHLVQNAHFAVDEHGFDYTSPAFLNADNYGKYFSVSDVSQGLIGNCWFVCAVGGLTLNYELLRKVCPFDNSFDDSKYTGNVHNYSLYFKFYL
jgi:hypothetical protein